jgi:hypothetical protein
MCFEISCVDEWITDGYGASLDRTSACRDPSASIVVMVTDTCPCYYPPNEYSNRRWCARVLGQLPCQMAGCLLV